MVSFRYLSLWATLTLATVVRAHSPTSQLSLTSAALKAQGRFGNLQFNPRRSTLPVATSNSISKAGLESRARQAQLRPTVNSLDPAVSAKSSVLQAQTERLRETIDLKTLDRLVLNQYFSPMAHQRSRALTCTPGLKGSQDFRALPLCPSFQPCGTKGHSARSGLVAACSAGFADPQGLSYPEIPRNCDKWHSMDKGVKLKLMGPYLRANLTTENARSLLLMKNPRLGCAQRRDFVPYSPVAFSVSQLKNVYVDSEAVIFNRTTMFLRLGCRDGAHYSLPPAFSAGAWEVKKVGAVVNWMYRQGANFYHSLIESFPLFLSLAPLMNKHRDLPILGLKRQFETYGNLLEPLVGVPLAKLRRYELQPTDLYHAETVYQPVYQYCGRQSQGMWTELRRRHLLHPKGVPLFNADWSMRQTTPLNDEEMATIPDDWVVVVGQRPGMERSLVQAEELLRAVRSFFPSKRIVVFRGDLTIMEARDLFRRAKLYIAAHGAALANMIFMPSGSSVLELRPDGYENNCFHSLADACSLKYHLLMGKGTKSTGLSVAIKNVSSLVQEISRSW